MRSLQRSIVLGPLVASLLFLIAAAPATEPVVQTTKTAPDDHAPIRLLIDIPEFGREGGPYRPRSLRVSPEGHFSVVVLNRSDKPVFLGRGNGIIRELSFELTDEQGNTTRVRQNHPAYAAYVSDQLRVGPGEATVINVSVAPKGAETYPFPAVREKVKLRAVLTTTGRADWAGTVASEPYDVQLEAGSD